jgi:hypothetical protein
MHIPTHILSGWCIGNLLPLNGRERLFCMIAAGAADFDGLGILFGEETYWDFHHKLGHNVFFAVLLSGVLASLSSRKWLAFEVFFVLAHLHLVLDYVGSGPGWPLYYLWPVSNMETFNPRAWPFFSWQNIATAYVLVGWAIWIAWRDGRTPLECLMPRLDRQLVAMLQRRGKTADNA